MAKILLIYICKLSDIIFLVKNNFMASETVCSTRGRLFYTIFGISRELYQVAENSNNYEKTGKHHFYKKYGFYRSEKSKNCEKTENQPKVEKQENIFFKPKLCFYRSEKSSIVK